MRLMVKRGMVVVATLALTLAACAADDPAESPSPAPPDESPAETQTEEPTEAPTLGGELTVQTYGGNWRECMTTHVVEPFEEATGVDVVLAEIPTSAEIFSRLQVEAGNPTLDIIVMGTGLDYNAAESGLMEEVDWATEAPNWNQLNPESQQFPGFGPSVGATAIGIAYNSEQMPFVPTSWYDLFDERLEGHVGLPADNAFAFALLWFLNEDNGGDVDNFDPGFEQLEQLADLSPVVYTSAAEGETAFVQRDMWVAAINTPRAIGLAREGLPIEFIYPEEGGFVWPSSVGIPRGTQNREAAIAYINTWIDADVQANWATCNNLPPSNAEADLGDYEYADALTMESAYPIPWAEIEPHRSTLTERYDREITSRAQ
jgi:spermidine/putrescine-binding protein